MTASVTRTNQLSQCSYFQPEKLFPLLFYNEVVERFHLRGKFIGTKEGVYKKKEFSSRGNRLGYH